MERREVERRRDRDELRRALRGTEASLVALVARDRGDGLCRPVVAGLLTDLVIGGGDIAPAVLAAEDGGPNEQVLAVLAVRLERLRADVRVHEEAGVCRGRMV